MSASTHRYHHTGIPTTDIVEGMVHMTVAFIEEAGAPVELLECAQGRHP